MRRTRSAQQADEGNLFRGAGAAEVLAGVHIDEAVAGKLRINLAAHHTCLTTAEQVGAD